MKLTKPILKNINELFISKDDKNIKLAKTMLINNDFDLDDFLEYFIVLFPINMIFTTSDEIYNKLKNSLLGLNIVRTFESHNTDNLKIDSFIAICFKLNKIQKHYQYIVHSELNNMIDIFEQNITTIEKYNISNNIKSFKIKD